MKKRFHRWAALSVASAVLFLACGAQAELSEDDIAFQEKAKKNELLALTVHKPGGQPYAQGKAGGTWLSSINSEPKTYNPLNNQDAETSVYLDKLFPSLLDYNPYKKTWKPHLASVEVVTDEKADKLEVTFTLRDDLYWTSLADPSLKVKVTSDDVVFWYNEIDGDEKLQQSGYAQQFLKMKDGSEQRITIEKIDERKFKFKYPRIVAMPELSSNTSFGPRFVFEPVKKDKGVEGLLNLWSIDTDPKTIPSLGEYYIENYKPGIGLTLVRNPNYFLKDDFGQSIPYIQRVEIKILPNRETEKLKFLAGEQDSYTLRPEDLDELVKKTPKDFTVYANGPALGSSFFAWNQNPKNLAPKYVKWFSQQKFRQAMSCFLNRDRIIDQIYRGLAEPATGFFATANPYYDPAIRQKNLYDPARGLQLLAEIGITKDAAGILHDADGNAIEYDLAVPSDNNVAIDIVNIFADELKKVGIKLNVKPLDFQKLVESLTRVYDWQAVMIGLGSNYWPTSGSNVWPSKGNLHLWNPLQAKPATDWEARLDDLYANGNVTRDPVKAKAIWDEFQTIILDQVPIVYLVRPYVFTGYYNKWGNLYADNLASPEFDHLYLQ